MAKILLDTKKSPNFQNIFSKNIYPLITDDNLVLILTSIYLRV